MSLLSRLAVQAARAYGMLARVGAPTDVAASYLVVAGGGAGGASGAGSGGGGAGGLLTSTATLSTLTTYTVTVGAGGSAITTSGYNTTRNNGSDSSLSGTGLTTITSTGGGGGSAGNIAGANGGSGGGGNGGYLTAGGTGTSGQGNAGGAGYGTSNYGGGGGGGASAVGQTAPSSSVAGNGGAGTASSISGSSVTYAGGGGGSTYQAGTQGSGGAGGGGAGSLSGTATSGTANTGGGGGGAGTLGSVTSGAGGSGIVIISYASATPKFVGGTLTTSGGNQIHTFTSSGTLSPLTPVTASYLVVAGGAGGGSNRSTNSGGGGGAGGLLTSSTTLYSGATYVVTVGAGGAGSTASTVNGANGTNSVLSGTGLTTVTSTGGGGGGDNQAGSSGGSGGGGGSNGGSNAGGAGTSGQGNAGGSAVYSVLYPGGGGGGSSAVGGNATSTVAGNGGAGTASSISGSSVTYAGGGGGGNSGTGTFGTATGGGGAGGNNGTLPTSGTANTGGGGGGAGYGAAGFKNGAAGGSGIVIISYAGSQAFNGGLVTSSGGNTIHTFTSTGALTPLTNNLTNSLRFRSSANGFLNRTPSVAGSGTTFTLSAWVKRGKLGANQVILCTSASLGTNVSVFEIDFTSSDTLDIFVYSTPTTNANLITTQVFRDPSAWYHIVVAFDTTQATAANRIKIYVNGTQITSFGTATYPSQNFNCYLNSTIPTLLGMYAASGYPTLAFDGYLAETYLIDGQALEPYYFGNNDANGVWKPILYKGTYGTNGFYLPFSDTSALTTSSNVGLGKDFSGNGNYFATNNISLTAGTTYDAMTDVPTNTSATVANYATLNPVYKAQSQPTISNGNLTQTPTTTTYQNAFSTIGVTSGKWYVEITMAGTPNSANYFGIANATQLNYLISNADVVGTSTGTGYAYVALNGQKYTNGGGTVYGAALASGDVLGIAFDADAGTLTFYKNGVSQGTAFTGIDATTTYFFGGSVYSGGVTSVSYNFGQRPFSYTPPTGFVALNTYNLPTPTILQGNKYMDATTYTAASPTNRVIVNQGQFKPDLVWIKSRSQTYNHYLFDSNRGVGAGALSSNLTSVQNWDTGTQLSSFNSNGYTISSGDAISDTSAVAWQWQAGQGSTSSNTSGSITSTVSVNTTAGFSVVTYTSQASGTATFGHGLGVAPSMIFLKSRNLVAGWYVYHSALGGTKYVVLQGTNAAITAADGWNNTNPTSTVVSVGNGYAGSYNMVAYCWAAISGFSAFGSYTGNGSTDGPFVYTGFRPKYLMIKRTDTAGYDWWVYDTSRDPYNVAFLILRPNTTNADAGTTGYDLNANGFKCRQTDVAVNASGGTYIYAAFAENPFKNANAR
jgi:hypothetical protein